MLKVRNKQTIENKMRTQKKKICKKNVMADLVMDIPC